MWEKELEALLNKSLDKGSFRTVPSSGALGTILGEPELSGDLKGRVSGLQFPIRIEAKVGYGGATQLTVKKEWLDKIDEEARATFSMPVLACRFSGSRKGVENFVVLDLDRFIWLLNAITELDDELIKCQEALTKFEE